MWRDEMRALRRKGTPDGSNGQSRLGADDLSEAVERVVAGLQRRTRDLTAEDRRRIAFHEAGHAVVAEALGASGVVSKVSIVGRRSHGGVTWYVSEADRVLATQEELEQRMAALLGGREAEVIEFGEPSTGAADDLRRAAGMARTMVWECDMGERLRPTCGAGVEGQPELSERLRSDRDAEAEEILFEAQDRARRALLANYLVVVCLAQTLIADETVEGVELAALLARVRGPRALVPVPA